MIRVIPVVLVVALYVYTFIDLATSRSSEVRLLPRAVWLLVVLVLPVLGPVLWLLLGRPHGGWGGGLAAFRLPRSPRPSRPSRPAPDDDPDFLRGL